MSDEPPSEESSAYSLPSPPLDSDFPSINSQSASTLPPVEDDVILDSVASSAQESSSESSPSSPPSSPDSDSSDEGIVVTEASSMPSSASPDSSRPHSSVERISRPVKRVSSLIDIPQARESEILSPAKLTTLSSRIAADDAEAARLEEETTGSTPEETEGETEGGGGGGEEEDPSAATSASSSLSVTHLPKQPPGYLKYAREDITSEQWRSHKKHIFILSDAGKPIFTRYGNLFDLNPMMAFFTTVISHVQHTGDNILRTIYGDSDFKVTFLSKGALRLMMISRTRESSREIATQLNFFYLQLVFILTEKLQDVLNRRRSFDLRTLLGGMDGALHHLVSMMSNTLIFSLSSTPCVRMNKRDRMAMADRLQAYYMQKLLFTVLISGLQIVSVVHTRRRPIQSDDLNLLINFVNASSALRSHEVWTPICLPGLSATGYVYAFIEFLDQSTDLCLVFVSADNQKFPLCQEARRRIVQDWVNNDSYNKVLSACANPLYDVEEVGLDSLRVIHFVYKNNALNQFTQSSFSHPFRSDKQKKRIVRMYKAVRENALFGRTQFKMYLEQTDTETVLCWISNDAELFVTFAGIESMAFAMEACERIKRWVKDHQDELFLAPLQYHK